jgi:glycosyltransferase 2 family protein
MTRHTRSGRTLLFGLVRLVLVPAALIWIVSSISSATLAAVVSDPTSLLTGLLVNQIALCLFALRMQLVLQLFALRIGWFAALRIHLQSVFYFFALPMTVGLEIARLIKIRQIQSGATVMQISSALLLDRLLGAGSAFAVVILCMPFVNAPIVPDVPSWAWLMGMALSVATCLIVVVSPWGRAQLAKFLGLVQGRWVGLAALFLFSMVMHVVFAAGVQFAARGLDLPISLLNTLVAVAGGMLLLVVPVSLAGLGPAEAGAAGLLFAMGYSPAIALAVGVLPYLARLVGALEGAVWEFVEVGSATIAALQRLNAERRSS